MSIKVLNENIGKFLCVLNTIQQEIITWIKYRKYFSLIFFQKDLIQHKNLMPK